jgi:hypothetical protein
MISLVVHGKILISNSHDAVIKVWNTDTCVCETPPKDKWALALWNAGRYIAETGTAARVRPPGGAVKI